MSSRLLQAKKIPFLANISLIRICDAGLILIKYGLCLNFKINSGNSMNCNGMYMKITFFYPSFEMHSTDIVPFKK